MRVWLLVAATLLLGAETLPVLAGGISQGSTMLSCAVLSGQTALPAGLCRHLATAVWASTPRIGVADFLASKPTVALLETRPVAAAPSPMAPATALKTSAAWQAHLDKGVASYGRILSDRGLAFALPAAPGVLWPGGSPFAPGSAD